MLIETWPIDKPIDYSNNARKWSAKAIEKVGASIKLFGWRQPVVVDAEGVIVIGHLRRAGGKSVGETTCPVHVARDLSPAKIKALRLADNRLHEEAVWDLDLLGPEFLELKALDFDLTATGFSTREIDRFTLTPNAAEDDVPPVPEAPVTQAGDLWLLGEHRLLCGDSTKAEDVRRLGGAFAAVVTDPPYGINADRMTLGTGKKQFHRAAFDNSRPDVRWLLAMAPRVCIWGGNYFADVLPISADWLCWHKKNDGLSYAEFEMAWTNFGRNARWYAHHWSGEIKLHPTMKPTAVMRWCLELAGSGSIFDPYLGAGSTLIASETRNQPCYGLEIDPAYCDVIVTRWQNLTGKEATLDGHGATFEHVKAGRRQGAEDELMEEAHERGSR